MLTPLTERGAGPAGSQHLGESREEKRRINPVVVDVLARTRFPERDERRHWGADAATGLRDRWRSHRKLGRVVDSRRAPGIPPRLSCLMTHQGAVETGHGTGFANFPAPCGNRGSGDHGLATSW